MSFRGFLHRRVVVALTTWILGAIIGSFAWGFYFALLPFLVWELLRPRRPRRLLQAPPPDPTTTERLP